jgi:monoamine oxidase
MRAHDRPHVIVAGAGLAGLRCAEILHRSGISVEIHEARDRVGGRCWSAHGLADGVVGEHGGEHIAPHHHYAIGLARELGLGLEDRMTATVRELRTGAMVFQGRKVLPGEGTAEIARALAVLTREGERVGDLRPDRAGDDARRLDEMTARDWLDAHVDGGTRSLVGRALQVASELTHGVSAERLSAAALVNMIADAAIAPAATKDGASNESSLGEMATESVLQLHVRGGNDLLAVCLAQRLPDGALMLASALTSLRVSPNGVMLRFDDGDDVHADAAVLALPLATMRELDTTEGHLPELWHRALEELSMGRNTKLLLGLDSAPAQLPSWPGHLLDLDDPSLVVWDTTQAQPGPGGLLTVFTAGEVFETSAPHAEPTPAALEQLVTRLDRTVTGLREAFTGRAWLDTWPLDPWTRGSYVAFGPGQFTRYWGVLAKPEGRIHFAGEHTQTTGQGYLDGAIESGERAAREVLDDFGLPFIPPSAGG